MDFGRLAKDFSPSLTPTGTRHVKITVEMHNAADKKLAERLLRGDRASFEQFFNAYFPRIYRFALSRLDHDHDLAEETAQAVLCQALSKMDTYRGEAPLFSWMCTFARYELFRQRKAVGRAQGESALNEDDPEIRAALESLMNVENSHPDVAAYRSELGQWVQVTLDQLPSLYSDTLEAKYVHGDSVREIAGRLGKTEKATESILTRARLAFRDAFRELLQSDQLLASDTLPPTPLFE